MKTTNISIFKRVALLFGLTLCAVVPSKAQIIPNTYMNVDWQYNIPLGSSTFADKGTGWGMNFEGGCYISNNITLGAFISYHTNLQSLPRQTIEIGETSTLTTAQEHAAFQLPFGFAGRYNFLVNDMFEPYVGLKLGAEYAQFSSYYYILKHYDNSWGFMFSPEIGVTIFPNPAQRFGFHVAAYFSHATNDGSLLVYDINNLNNFGFRVGVSF